MSVFNSKPTSLSSFGKWSFVAFFVIGFVGIMFFKFAYSHSQWYASAWAAAVLVVYLICLLVSKTREDQAGDNLYYLGFLFTLLSLSFALFGFSVNERSTTNLISNFGIALTSTILGMAFRVFYNQLGTYPQEIERSAHLELVQAVQKLKMELNDAVITFAAFKTDLQAQMTNTFISIEQDTIKRIGDVTNNFESSAVDIISQVQTASENSIESSKKINQNTEKCADSMQNLILRIDQIQIPRNLVERRFDSLTEDFKVFLYAVRDKLDHFSENVDRINSSMDKCAGSIEGFVGKVDSISIPENMLEKSIRPIVDSIDDMVKRFDHNGDKMDQKFEKFAKMIENAANTSKIFDNHVKSLNDQTQHFEQLFKKLEQTANYFEGIGRLSQNSLDQISSSFKKFFDDFSEIQADARKRIEAINKEISRLAECSFDQISGSFKQFSGDFSEIRVEARKKIEAGNNDLGKIIDSQSTELKEIGFLINNISKTRASFGAEAENMLKVMRAFNGSLEEQLNGSAAAAGKVHDSLSNMVDLMTDKLKVS